MGFVLFPSSLLGDCRLICDWIISIHRNIKLSARLKEAKGVIISNFAQNWLFAFNVDMVKSVVTSQLLPCHATL